MLYVRNLFLLSLFFVYTASFESPMKRKLLVDVCPDYPIMKNVLKEKLLGFWYAYATTPLNFRNYRRRCASYNVKNSPYFNTSILYTNYDQLAITYSCLFNQKEEKFNMKLRILTRTRTPMSQTITEALKFLSGITFPIETLDWLKSEAFCFEWYQLKFETERRPKQFQAPFNHPDY